MDREKQIEEMAFIALKNVMTYTCAKQIAINFYDAGYRKDEEYRSEIARLKLENQAYSDSADTLIAEQDNFAKEQRRLAVKEFASKLKDKAVDFLYSAAVDGHPGFDINISELCHMIDELLEEYEK